MKRLLSKIEKEKKGGIKAVIDGRIKEFEKKGKASDDEIFSELCFCLMTANFQAEKSIRIQEDLCNRFHLLSEEELVKELRKHGHRFPNMRARFIFEARKHHKLLKRALSTLSTDARRLWLVKNVKGLGMKESSHFLRNIGYKNYAIIDFHIIDLLSDHGLVEKPKAKSLTPIRYVEIEKVLESICKKVGLDQAELDLYLWYIETGKVLK